jgi:dihydrofolate reductase
MAASDSTIGRLQVAAMTARCSSVTWRTSGRTSPAGAVQRAKEIAGDQNVAVMGGADIGQQFIKAGLVDEIGIHLVPVLFGSGLRMFEHIGDQHIHLESIETINSPAATHLRYRVVK